MNRFNLLEGGLFKLVAIENEGEEYMSIALKSIDVIVTNVLNITLFSSIGSKTH